MSKRPTFAREVQNGCKGLHVHNLCSTTRLRLPIKGFGDSESWRVCLKLFGSVVVCMNIKTCLIFFTTITDPLSPLPTNSLVSGFLRHPQTQMYTILRCRRRPATLKPKTLCPRKLGLSPRPPRKIGHCCLKKSVISPRRPEEASDQSETQSVYPQ